MKEWKNISKWIILNQTSTSIPCKLKSVFFRNTKKTHLQPSTIRKWIVRVHAKYNLNEITTHGLRHPHSSLLFEAGASIKEVQNHLGHADAKITMNIYAHVSKKSQEVAVQKFKKFMENLIRCEYDFEYG
ncbi:MAG: tyrosine-type recombinase/integrase [Solibacillus sp.]|uniref:tyrosine-type recombinase/integrase n=1 Tax=Solibacillus sp. TaxID=1909654 RepID=UPI00331506D4